MVMVIFTVQLVFLEVG